MFYLIERPLRHLLKDIVFPTEIAFTTPPNPDLGDLALPCFEIGKRKGKNPVEVAKEIESKVNSPDGGLKSKVIDDVRAVGPFVNFFLNGQEVAKLVLPEVNEKFGRHSFGNDKKIMVEFGCPNPLKVFHLGHLKNLITGEAIVRILQNMGYSVIRANYQGDVGLHVAKALWGIFNWLDQFEDSKKMSLEDRIAFLGKAYAHGAKHFEAGETAKEEILAYNNKVYTHDVTIQTVYQTARQWSLEYFDSIYKKLGSHFDKLYFESEVTLRGAALVFEFLKKDIFKKSQGAIIFEGSRYGLHDRVFLNSEGFPTYEAKELALAEMRYNEFHPDSIIHVVGKEQTEYFKVVFKALEFVVPESGGKEVHLPGGFLRLKGGKMSSRTGNVIAGDQLIELVDTRVRGIMTKSDHKENEDTIRKITNAVLKYSLLKVDVRSDVVFDMEESVSTSGDSGPYLLYTIARIKSILRKAITILPKTTIPVEINVNEKKLLLRLSLFPEVTKEAGETFDPARIARYIFSLAQEFQAFYDICPVLQADETTRSFRLEIIHCVEQVMTRGLYLLGIEPVEEM